MDLGSDGMLLVCSHSSSSHPSGNHSKLRAVAEQTFYNILWDIFVRELATNQSYKNIKPTNDLFNRARDSIFEHWDGQNIKRLEEFRIIYSNSDEGSEIRDLIAKRMTVLEGVSLERLFLLVLRVITDRQDGSD